MREKPKPDRTPLEEVDDAIQENIRLGYMVEVSPEQFSLTPAGLENARRLLKMSPVEELLRTYVAAINGESELRVGLRMCADAMEQAADEITRLNAENEWALKVLERVINIPAIRQILGTRHTTDCDCPICQARALITKASRDSGHG